MEKLKKTHSSSSRDSDRFARTSDGHTDRKGDSLLRMHRANKSDEDEEGSSAGKLASSDNEDDGKTSFSSAFFKHFYFSQVCPMMSFIKLKEF